MKLETLYKTSAKGATQIIDMEILGDTYTRSWGQLDGKMQTKSTTAIGKNIGKANETTPSEQAIIEAKAVWAKKQKANYSTSQNAPVTVKLPMKVNDYTKHTKKVVFPCYTSVKLNGVNAEYRLVDGVLKLLSRGGEDYPIPPHQSDDILHIMKILGTTSLNGEMYIHGEYLQDIMAATKKPNDLSPSLVFWIFDFPELGDNYATRCASAYHTIGKDNERAMSHVKLVNVGMASDHAAIKAQHLLVVAQGYEGIIIRNGEGLYEYNKRSLDVFKYKVAQDAEFKSIGFKLDKNAHPVFNCLVDSTLPVSDENTFKVKLKGTAEDRIAMGIIAGTLIGQYIKVEFEMRSKIGKPQKPVGIMFRAVDANGEAVE